MIRHALPVVAGFLSLALSLSAQSLGPIEPGFFALNQLGPGGVTDARTALARADILANNTYDGLASLTLADGRFFSFPSAFGWMELATTPDFLPAMMLEQPQRVAPVATTYHTDAGTKAMELLPRFDYAHGEVGFLYGKSTGKFGREVKEGYIMGEIGNDKTQISVGASYGQSNGRFPLDFGH